VSFKLIPTPPFERELKKLTRKHPSLKKDIEALGKELLLNPHLGVSLGSDCFKIRMAISSKGKGKSGGARVITYVQIINEAIFLIAIYDKSEMENISENDIQSRLKRIN
jgi:mRNA-degrading endonuclease RelE of RelBE toxin-antitoxin system